MGSIIKEDFTDIALAGVDVIATFSAVPVRPKSGDSGLITPKPVPVRAVDGKLTSPNLDGGPGRVLIEAGTWIQSYDIVFPESGEHRLRDLIEAYEVPNPPVVSLVKKFRDETVEARDIAVTAAESVGHIADDVEQIAQDRAAAELARDKSIEAQGHSESAADLAGSSATNAGNAARDAKDFRDGAEEFAAAADGSARAAGQSESAASRHKEDAESAAERSEQVASGIQDVAEDAAQVAEDRLAVESAAAAVATDRQAVADALDVVVTAKVEVEEIQTDVHQTKTSIENTANLVDQTLEQYGAQFVTERELSQQAVTDATTQAQRAEDAAEGIIAGSVLDGAVTTPKLADEAVTKAKTSPSVQTSLGKADTSVQEGDSRLTDARPPTAHSHSVADVTGLQGALDGKAPTSHGHAIAQVTGLADALAAKMTEAQAEAIATAAIAAWVGNAPEALDTLAELAAALGNDPNFATTVMAAIGQRAMASHSHVAAEISDATTVGRNVMKAADAAAARGAIGAGTGNGNSNLALGTTSSTAMRGDANQFVTVLPTTGQLTGVIYHVTE
ncbi:hypothetical protein ACIGKR_29760 [Rhodococcus qingshengii]|uniref:hypothetical protein n=1 Tax=Rhodococcus qingshengii TaxID=334542 RepID=UPI0037C5476C